MSEGGSGKNWGIYPLDGAKIKANASKHKAMSYKRMKKGKAHLEAEIKEMLQKAVAVDEEEDRRYGNSSSRTIPLSQRVYLPGR